MKNKTMLIFILLAFALPVAVFFLVTWYQDKYDTLPVYYAEDKNQNFLAHLASYNLYNQDGKKVVPENWENKILVADFFFTRCLSICPKMTAALKQVNENFANVKFLQILSFSVDPERDSAQQLKKYSLQCDLNTDHWTLLTGDKKDIYKLARNGFKIVATEGDGGPDDFIHSDKLVLVDKQKKIRGYYNGTSKTDVEKLITDIKKLANE